MWRYFSISAKESFYEFKHSEAEENDLCLSEQLSIDDATLKSRIFVRGDEYWLGFGSST